jgi:hypothetical protein
MRTEFVLETSVHFNTFTRLFTRKSFIDLRGLRNQPFLDTAAGHQDQIPQTCSEQMINMEGTAEKYNEKDLQCFLDL